MLRIRSFILTLLGILIIGSVASASASAGALAWDVNGTEEASGQKTVISGGEIKLKAGAKTVTCTTTEGKGTVESLGKAQDSEIKLTGCTTGQEGCKVKTSGQPNGTILMTSIPQKLVERPLEAIANNFEQNATTKEFATLQFEGGTCSPTYPASTKITGTVAAEGLNKTSNEVEFNLPSPELEGNTLKAFGVAASLTGRLTLKREAGGEVKILAGSLSSNFNTVLFTASPQTMDVTITFNANIFGGTSGVLTSTITNENQPGAFSEESIAMPCVGANLTDTVKCKVRVKFVGTAGAKGKLKVTGALGTGSVTVGLED